MPTLTLPYPRQQGSVLLIGMILLVVLMLGATTIMNSAVQDERVTGNSKASTEAFFAAEAGQLEAWNELTSEEEKVKGYEKWKDIFKNVKENGNHPGPQNSIGRARYNVTFKEVRDADGNLVDKFRVVSTGSLDNGAARTIVMELDGNPTGGGGFVDAPAAISCFGSSCNIKPGNASEAAISGRDHPVPEPDCGGKGGRNCWEDPRINGASVPAVFLTDRGNSQLIGANGNKKNAYHGQDRTKADDENTPYTLGNNRDANSVWDPSDYPEGSAPTYDQYFGNSEDAVLRNILDGAKLSPPPDGLIVLDTATDSAIPINDKSTSGIMVIDGNGKNDIETPGGTGFFSGLIVLRNCNKIQTKGNFTIYGAIIVEGKDSNGKPCDCVDDDCENRTTYSPFEGNGTIDVKYSLDALNQAGFGTGNGNGPGGPAMNQFDWYEIIEG